MNAGGVMQGKAVMKRADIPTRKQVAVRVLRKLAAPRDLWRYLVFKFVTGDEYPYFDFADAFPHLARLVSGCPARRLSVDAPIFLAGLRRSGTTVLYRVMAAHSRVFLFNERFPGDRMNGRGVASQHNLLYAGHHPDRFRCLALSYLGPRLRMGYDRWGAKLALELAHPDPGSISAAALERILAAFPASRVIAITRDPRDFVMSALKRGGHDVQWWIDEYIAMMKLFDTLRAAYRDAVQIIRYEDLVLDPAATIRRCCEFAALPYESGMLDASHWSNKGPREYERTAIVPGVDKWRAAAGGELAVVRRVAAACFPPAARFGYEPGEHGGGVD